MGLISDKALALELASLVVNPNDEMLCVTDDKSADALLLTKPVGQARFLWVSGVTKPVYKMWQFREAGFLTGDCHVLFTGVSDCPDWSDLVKIYGGLRFGSLFLVKLSPNTKPGVCPSQCGMYFK